MQSFWTGFEKRAVSMAWVHKMKNRGLLSRAKFKNPKRNEEIADIINRNYLSDISGGHAPLKKSWKDKIFTSKPSEVLEDISDVNKETKGNPGGARKLLARAPDSDIGFIIRNKPRPGGKP